MTIAIILLASIYVIVTLMVAGINLTEFTYSRDRAKDTSGPYGEERAREYADEARGAARRVFTAYAWPLWVLHIILGALVAARAIEESK